MNVRIHEQLRLPMAAAAGELSHDRDGSATQTEAPAPILMQVV